MAGRGCVIIAGPTASGKSALALGLAEALACDGLPAVLINADSMQVYRELAILTARPVAAHCERIPHRLYGALPAAEACSAGRWRTLALAEIAAAHRAGRLPVLVGGTGLYIEALTRGLAPVPPVPRAVRDRADARLAALGPRAFHAELAVSDPAACTLNPADTQRVKRAWAVLEATGRTLREWQAGAHDPLPGPLLRILVWPERAALNSACDARFAVMMKKGALEEAGVLARHGLDPSLPAMKALGVPALLAHIAGVLDLDAAMARAQRATRHYAKRQCTWFRRRYPADLTVAQPHVAACRDAVLRLFG